MHVFACVVVLLHWVSGSCPDARSVLLRVAALCCGCYCCNALVGMPQRAHQSIPLPLAYATLCHIGCGSVLYANACRHAATCSSACYNVLSRALHYTFGCADAPVTCMLFACVVVLSHWVSGSCPDARSVLLHVAALCCECYCTRCIARGVLLHTVLVAWGARVTAIAVSMCASRLMCWVRNGGFAVRHSCEHIQNPACTPHERSPRTGGRGFRLCSQ